MVSKLEWIENVNTFRESGLTMKAYCTEKDLGYQAFRYWCRKLAAQADEIENKSVGGLFVPLKIKETGVAVIALRVNGVEVAVEHNANPAHLKNVILLLKEC